MTKPRDQGESGSLDRLVGGATAGDSQALDALMRAVRGDVYALALRYLWNPEDAEDACQEILIRVLTGLGGFRGGSAFRTWVYRVACNALLTMSKQRRQHPSLSFDELGEDLVRGLSGSALREEDSASERLLLEEIKIGCTLAMLQCLDRDHRLAYILGEIMEFDHVEASKALSTKPAAFRKRLSRARDQVNSFMLGTCGLVDPANACRCDKRKSAAIELGRVDPGKLVFAISAAHAGRFPEVLAQVRSLEAGRRAAALYRSHPGAPDAKPFSAWLSALSRATTNADQPNSA